MMAGMPCPHPPAQPLRRAVPALTLALAGLLASPGTPARPAQAPSSALVLLVDDSAEMPSARTDRGQVVDGISHDLGLLLARRLGRELHFLVLPRRRVASALASGEADLLCDYLPDWLPGPFTWSRPFLPNVTWVVTRADKPWPGSVQGLSGQRVGAVGGYAYPELQRALGDRLVRDDAPNSAANLRKLGAGRVDHVVLSQRYLQYQQRIGALTTPLHPPLVVGSYLSQCALSPRSSVDLPALNHALSELSSDGSLERMLQRYR